MAQTPDIGAELFELIGDVNPSRSRTNCAACALAVESTLRGVPAVAAESRGTTHWSPAQDVDVEPVPDRAAIEAAMAGDSGGRGIVVAFTRDGTAGHAFNAVHHAGRAVFIDGQTGTTYPPDATFWGEFAVLFFARTA